MRLSGKQLDLNLPYWRDYLPFLQRLCGPDFPSCEQLNAMLPEGLSTASGQPIRFVPSTELDDGGYEHRIYTSGRISTRPDNWHDLFNALVWMRFPRLKIAMNSLHFHALSEEHDGSRGKLRYPERVVTAWENSWGNKTRAELPELQASCSNYDLQACR